MIQIENKYVLNTPTRYIIFMWGSVHLSVRTCAATARTSHQYSRRNSRLCPFQESRKGAELQHETKSRSASRGSTFSYRRSATTTPLPQSTAPQEISPAAAEKAASALSRRVGSRQCEQDFPHPLRLARLQLSCSRSATPTPTESRRLKRSAQLPKQPLQPSRGGPGRDSASKTQTRSVSRASALLFGDCECRRRTWPRGRHHRRG